MPEPNLSGLNDLQRLVEIEAIRFLVGRRIRALDEHTWDIYEALHAPDYQADNEGEPPLRGSAANASRLKALYDAVAMVSAHHVHSHEIALLSPTTASGTWAMEDQLWWTHGGRTHWLHGTGFYHETYEKREGAWLFTTRKLRRTRQVVSEGAEMPGYTFTQ
jgi:hypothetical protein